MEEVQQVEVDDDFCGHVYQIHEMLHMMANYIYRRKKSHMSIISSRLCSGQNYDTDVLGSAGIGSVQK